MTLKMWEVTAGKPCGKKSINPVKNVVLTTDHLVLVFRSKKPKFSLRTAVNKYRREDSFYFPMALKPNAGYGFLILDKVS